MSERPRRQVATDGGIDRPNEDPDWKVGVARQPITPDEDGGNHLAGFAARDGEMDEIEHDIFARALALEDRTGRRVVVLSFELIFALSEQREMLESMAEERWNVEPDALILNPSHTHYGPEYSLRPEELDDNPSDRDRARAAYRERLDETLIATIDEAIEDLEPAHLTYYQTSCAIAVSRRYPDEERVRFDPFSDAPVDHDVPVLTAESMDGTRKLLAFGYACHPTVGQSYNGVSGDWAGYAMQYLEESYPEATAMFLIGCAGDQKAYPHGTRERVKQHGRTMATAVERALVTEPRVIRGTGTFKLLEQNAVLDVENYEEGDEGIERLVEYRDYPIQAVGFGGDLTLLSLSGEVVAEYGTKIKSELAAPVWVAAYANSCGYIPTERVLAEGGYEAKKGRGGQYAPSTENRIVDKAIALAERVGARRR
ncbi:neutral/alkaline non-lysosomal ceramidase N-terminal domain-containing protein [Haloprofundus salinisoli]|uniref:neutral/alkaline non-lysosomal ceramidase N-terminal domain-containing protein n=1 Tax=Haloprofundus salinisoli TaxID=2876193 RepID=UPI001CCFD04D|nr:neutral/alkaline non-lysosomal ceramidase N-terminal domain-containing protein [Haloprofundus salinisoli]